MDRLPEDLARIIDGLCRHGDELAEIDQFDDAIIKYREAWEVLPEPKAQWPAATWILLALGDAHFNEKRYEFAANLLLDALDCPGGYENPFLFLRLGQCFFEEHNLDDAADAFEEAYRQGGESVFEGEPSRYLAFLKTHLGQMKIKPTSGRYNKPLN